MFSLVKEQMKLHRSVLARRGRREGDGSENLKLQDDRTLT